MSRRFTHASIPNPLYGGSSGLWVIVPCRLGDVHDSLEHRPVRRSSSPVCMRHRGRCRPGLLLWGVVICTLVHNNTLVQAEPRKTQRRLVRGDATAGSEEGTFRIRGRCARVAWTCGGKAEVVDVKKAHVNSWCDKEGWVELPDAFEEHGRCAKLRRWLYSMRKAALG